MKRFIYILLLNVVILSFISCSQKHKVRQLNKQKTAYQQKSQQQKIRQTQSAILDTNTLRYQLAQGHYQLWDLKGEIQLLPDGSMQAQEAKIYSWTTKELAFEEDKRKLIHATNIETKSQANEEQRSQSTKSKTQTKHKTTPLWWFLILLTILGILVWRKR